MRVHVIGDSFIRHLTRGRNSIGNGLHLGPNISATCKCTALPGGDIQRVRRKLSRQALRNTDVLAIVAGGNDLTRADVSVEDVFANMAGLVEDVRSVSPDIVVVLYSVLPRGYTRSTKPVVVYNAEVAEYNELLKQLQANDKTLVWQLQFKGYQHIDLLTDSVHLDTIRANRMAKSVKASLRRAASILFDL